MPARHRNQFPARRHYTPEDGESLREAVERLDARLAQVEQRAARAEAAATRASLWLFALQYALVTHAKETGAPMPRVSPPEWEGRHLP